MQKGSQMLATRHRVLAHRVLRTRLDDPQAAAFVTLDLAFGCFWGAERVMWTQPGVWCTAVGYEGGHTSWPTYRQVCTGRTGHAETVRVLFDPELTSSERLLQVFFESHDPTQGARQGNDVGDQYRSVVFTTRDRDAQCARELAAAYGDRLKERGWPPITTEIRDPDPTRRFWLAEDDHQQYLAANPTGYCGLGGTGVTCPIRED